MKNDKKNKVVAMILKALGFDAMAKDALSGYKLAEHARIAIKLTRRYHGNSKAKEIENKFRLLNIE